MEFSVALNPYIDHFLNEGDASFFLIFIYCFGFLLLIAVVALLIKPLKCFQKLSNMIMLPLVLTWPFSIAFTEILYGLDIAAIKIITVIALTYFLMLIYCLLNLNLLTKYLNSFPKT